MHRRNWWQRKDKSPASNARLQTPAGASTKQNLISETATDSVDHHAAIEDLWDKAYIDLRNSDGALVARFEKLLLPEEPGNSGAVSNEEQLTEIIENKLATMKQKQWVVKIAGKSLEVREQLERLVKVVVIAKESLNVVANVDPIHLGVPVAALCLLIPLMVNDSQQRAAAIEGLSYIAILMCRFAKIEKLYLRDKRFTETTALASETIKLYRSILEFQIRIICQLDRNTAHQFARNVVKADGWEEQIDQIKLYEAACEKCRVLLDTKERQQGMEHLDSSLRKMGFEFQQQCGTILSELKSSRVDDCRSMSQLESECLYTLRTLDYESDKLRIADRVPKTCEWFLSHEKYKIWLSETHSQLLWVTADPGCGKSVLSKSLIDSYISDATSGTTSVCYFFFRDGSEKNQDGTNTLCALLHQLFGQNRTLLQHALPDFEHNKTKLSGLFETLWSIFLRAATDSEAGSIICVLDALDECGEKTRTPLLRHIGTFCSDPPASASVKFILTSRPYPTIGDSLWEFYPSMPSVRLMGENEFEMSTIQKEISLVIDKRVERFREKRRQYNIHDDAHHAISEQLAQIENRTYLWVSLIFPELDKNVRSSQSNLLRIIKALPSSVQEAYEKILNDSTDTTKARKLLHIVLAAQRPFTLQEMNTALAITEDCTFPDDLELEPEPTFRETVRELCGLFISVSDSKIYLIHQKAREFLLAPNLKTKPAPNVKDTWMYSMESNKSHIELAKTCLLYLHLSGIQLDPDIAHLNSMNEQRGRTFPSYPISMESMAEQMSRDFTSYSTSLEAFQKQAFQSYSATYWVLHVLKTDFQAANSLMRSMLSITCPGSQAYLNWVSSMEPINHRIALGSSVGLLRGLDGYQIVSAIQLPDNLTVKQKIAAFRQAPLRQYVQGTADSEKWRREHLGTVPEESKISQPTTHEPSDFHELGMPKSLAAVESNNCGRLPPPQESIPCSEFLPRLAKLQQRLFNVDECLYYLESNPGDCTETIDDLITMMSGQESREFDNNDRSLLSLAK